MHSWLVLLQYEHGRPPSHYITLNIIRFRVLPWPSCELVSYGESEAVTFFDKHGKPRGLDDAFLEAVVHCLNPFRVQYLPSSRYRTESTSCYCDGVQDDNRRKSDNAVDCLCINHVCHEKRANKLFG